MRAAAALTVAVVCAAAAGRGYSQTLPPGVAACRAGIEQQRTANVDSATNAPQRLADICPDIVEALDESVWGPMLVGNGAGDLAPNEFVVLVNLADSYRSTPARAPISTAALDAAVAEVETGVPPPPPSFWDRVMQWLQERFGSDETQSPGWLEQWLKGLSVPERVTRYIVIALAVLLAAATAAVVLNELRAVGAFGKAAARRVRSGGLDVPLERLGGRPRSLADVRRAASALQPALLLRLIVDRLKSRAPLRDSLTHRELVRASDVALTGAQVESLRSVAAAAERVTYGDWRPTDDDVEAVVADAETLLGSLDDEPVADE